MATLRHRILPLLVLATAAAVLTACAEMGGNQLPPTQPVSSLKLSKIRTGMTYAQFEAIFGLGWLSASSPTHDKYWFLDDARIVAVPPTVWQSPTNPLTYRIIGHAPTSQTTPVLLPMTPLLPQSPANKH